MSGPSGSDTGIREGSLQAPSRHPLDWRSPEFVDEQALEKELERRALVDRIEQRGE